jgi:hypothetical protein
MVKPSPSTITVKTVPLTTAVPAGVSTSYFEEESTSFCTRLTVLPTNCVKLMEVDPVLARVISFIWISLLAPTSMTLPSKKTIKADPSLPVLSWSPTSSFIPAVAAVQAVEPLFFTSTSPLGDDRVPGGEEVPGDDAGVDVIVGAIAGVGVVAVSPSPPQLTIGTNKISANSKADHLRTPLSLGIKRPPV